MTRTSSEITRDMMKIERALDTFEDGMQYDPKWARLHKKYDALLNELDECES